MGVITCDVTGLGVVVTVDSQPTLITERRVNVSNRPLDRTRLIARDAADFGGYLSFVGTEEIDDVTTGEFLTEHSNSRGDLSLADYLDTLAVDLTEAWQRNELVTGLYIHVQGACAGEPVFRIVNNIGGMERTDYLDITTAFKAVNDLDENLIPAWELHAGEGKQRVLSRTIGYLRNGSLRGYLEPFDDFNGLMSKLYDGRYDGFESFSTIQAYAALVRMRAEFITRIFKPSKGLYSGAQPVHGPVEVRAVGLDGGRWVIPVKDAARRDK